MDHKDPRAVVALAIIAAIQKSLHGVPNGHATTEMDLTQVRQALIICLAMLIEADKSMISRDDIRHAADSAARDLHAQLDYMRSQYEQHGVRMWNVMSETMNWWWG